MDYFSCASIEHMILYLSVLEFLTNYPKHFPCNVLQLYVLYQVLPGIQSELCFSVSYFNYSFVSILHNIPTWCNIVFNKNEVIIYGYVVFILSIDIIVSFPQLLHLIAILHCILIIFLRIIPTTNIKH